MTLPRLPSAFPARSPVGRPKVPSVQTPRSRSRPGPEPQSPPAQLLGHANLVDHGDIRPRSRRRAVSISSSDDQSSTMPRLLRFRVRNAGESSPAGGAHLRDRSPCGGSILMTSAPASPSDIAVYGPATPSEISMTRYPSSGPATSVTDHRSRLIGRCPPRCQLVENLAGVLTRQAGAEPASRRA